MNNHTMMQYFEWNLSADGNHWKKCKEDAKKIKESGIDTLWLPPAYKGAQGSLDVGYGVYDLYDLGEFFQKGTTAVKYGTKDEYIQAVKALQEVGIAVLADIVLNHRMGADEAEQVRAVEGNNCNRKEQIGTEQEVTVWTRFTFPGRAGKYSSFTWSWKHFDGTDWDEKAKRKAIYLFQDKTWECQTDEENGNYDYLMGADVDMDHPEVLEEMHRWMEWYMKEVSPDGFRLDAVKHIRFDFFAELLESIRKKTGRELFAVGEYWSPDIHKLTNYLQASHGCMALFDVPLHFHFFEASKGGGGYDMSKLFRDTLVEKEPGKAVTFVDNHDTQPGQALSSFVETWFKPLAYAVILLQEKGFPCVFYGDYYGIAKDEVAPLSLLPKLIALRRDYAYGQQHDYFDDSCVVGFTREGDNEHSDSGLAVLLSDSVNGSKKMYVGKQHAGKLFYDRTGNCVIPVSIAEDGTAVFYVDGRTVSVWSI